MKKRSFYISIASIILLLAIGAVAFTQTMDIKRGQDIKSIRQNSDAKKVVAKVDGESIDLQTFQVEQYVQTNSLGGQQPSNEAVLSKVVAKKLLVKKAKRLGIQVADSEVKEFMKNTQEAIGNMPDEERSAFASYLDGLGMSEAEFWSDNEVFSAYKNSLYIGKLRGEFLKGATTPEEIESANQKLKDLEDNLVKDAKVEIVNPALLK